MAKKTEISEPKKVTVGVYPDEKDTVTAKIKEAGQELIGNELSAKDIRVYFGLKETHREGVKGELKAEIKELSVEQQKELLEEIRKKKSE